MLNIDWLPTGFAPRQQTRKHRTWSRIELNQGLSIVDKKLSYMDMKRRKIKCAISWCIVTHRERQNLKPPSYSDAKSHDEFYSV